MTSTTNRLVGEFVEFLTPVYLAFQSATAFEQFLRRLGYDPDEVSTASALAAFADTAEGLADLIELVGEASWTDQPPDETDLLQIAAQAPELLQGLRELPDELENLNLEPEFFTELVDLLLADYLRFRIPAVWQALIMLGVVEVEVLTPEDEGGRDVVFERYHIRWERLQRLLDAPFDLMAELYRLGEPEFDSARLLSNLAFLLDALGVTGLPVELPSQLDPLLPDLEEPTSPLPGLELPVGDTVVGDVNLQARLLALPLEGQSTPVEADRGIGIMPLTEGALSEETDITDDGTLVLHVEADAEVAGGTLFGLHPSGLLIAAGVFDGSSAAGAFRMEIDKSPTGDETAILLFGDPVGTRLEAQRLTFGVGGEDGDFYLAAGVTDLRLVLDASSDALLSQVLSDPVTVDAGDLAGGWRLGRGFYLEQGSGLSVTVPLSTRLGGGLALRRLGLRLDFEPVTAFAATVSGDLQIGPLFLSVEELGFGIAIRSDPGGRFGTFDLDAGIRFPAGYAAHLEAGPISGGGLLSKGDHEYQGALALRFETFGLSAFAILTTQMPSGQPGFSFLATIFGDLDVQLGYGLRLTGIGGIIGIERGVDVEALLSVLSEGRLDSILFPAAPIQDAAVILEDMAAVFPPRTGQYVVGPMARLAWGTPTLIEGKLGLVLEVGAETRAVILGSLAAKLPVGAAPVVALRADFIGTVEFSSGAIGFDATLIESRILTWPVSGEMAVRSGWGPSAGLVASVGGFHPEFPAPPGFPRLQPMTIDFATNNPSLTLTAYMAITLNSVQAGAEASLYVKGPKIIFVGRFEVEGSAGFDALITFNPFAFDTNMWLGLELLLDGDVVCSIGGDLRLRGPNRYEINGKVWAKVLGVTVKVKVNERWGSPVTEIPQVADGAAVLQAAVEAASGFEPILVPTRISGVGFSPGTRRDAPDVIDPGGGLRFVQLALPLGVAIDRIGTSRLVGGSDIFDLVFTEDGSRIEGGDATSSFVRGAFFDLTESERLRGPATEPHKSGLELRGPEDLVFDDTAVRSFEFEYETVFLGDDEEDTSPTTDHLPDLVVLERFARMAAERTSKPLSSGYVPPVLRGGRLGVAPLSYVAVGAEAVDRGPRPISRPDGDIVSGALSTVTSRLGAGERAIASYFTAPVG